MKNSEIRALSTEDLLEKVKSTEKALQSLRFANAVSQIENPMRIRQTKKDIARMKTELQARVDQELAEKVKSGELNQYTAREILSKTRFAVPVNLVKLKRIISKTGN